MRNLKNKKLLAPIIAGVLATMMIIGIGTYAWFTAKTETDVEGTFYAARVGIDVEGAEFNAYDFYPGAAWEYTRMFQSILEGYANDPWSLQAEFRGRMISLYDGFVGDPLRTVITAMDVPVAPKPNEVMLIQNPFNKAIQNGDTTFVWNITPGSILEAKFAFNVSGKSYIPVYFRISDAALVDAATGLDTDFKHAVTYIASIVGTKNDPAEVVELYGALIRGTDGFFYCPVPLSPEFGWTIEIINVAYIFGAANNDPDLQGQAVKFAGVGGPVVADLIQATNNAVYMADGWKDVAAQLIPYVDAKLYQEYKDIWTAIGFPEIKP